MEVVDYIKSDYKMFSLHKDTFHGFIVDYFKDRSIRFTFWLRLCQCYGGFFFKYMWKRYSTRFCLDIRPKTRIGKGFRLPHGMCVVINENTIIGENVIIMQFVTIGEKNGESPIIEDGVKIFANSAIIGGVKIGKQSIVGAGSVVTKDIPPGEIWAGNPAKFLKKINSCNP